MAALTINTVSRTVTSLPGTMVAAAGGGDYFVNSGYEYAIFKNTDGTPVTVTLTYQATGEFASAVSKTIVVPATTGFSIVGPFPTTSYNDANSRMQFTYSGVTALTVGIYKNTTS